MPGALLRAQKDLLLLVVVIVLVINRIVRSSVQV